MNIKQLRRSLRSSLNLPVDGFFARFFAPNPRQDSPTQDTLTQDPPDTIQYWQQKAMYDPKPPKLSPSYMFEEYEERQMHYRNQIHRLGREKRRDDGSPVIGGKPKSVVRNADAAVSPND